MIADKSRKEAGLYSTVLWVAAWDLRQKFNSFLSLKLFKTNNGKVCVHFCIYWSRNTAKLVKGGYYVDIYTSKCSMVRSITFQVVLNTCSS